MRSLFGLAAVAATLMMVPGGTVAAGQTAVGSPPAPAFTKDVAPILFNSCASCHRPGEVAPMSLLSYQDARPWAKAIKQKVVSREMPPWYADPHFSDVKFRNDRRLTAQQIDTISRWADAGAPKGDDADMPKVPDFGSGWKYGEPDYIIDMPIEYKLPAEGEIDYLTFYVPSPFDRDVFVEKIEMRPSNKAVVHHETAWSTTLRDDIKIVDGLPYSLDGKALAKNELRPAGTSVFDAPPQTKLICYVPGRGYEQHRPGTAKRIEGGKNKYIVFDVHYQPSGKPETDRSRIGLWFSKVPVTHEVITEMVGGGAGGVRLLGGGVLPPMAPVTTNGITRVRPKIPNIPAYAEHWEITGITPVPDAITLYGLSPHMHLRGKDVYYKIVYPDGTEKPVLNVPKYDFNWQLFYELDQPLKIPAGSKIVALGHFDNSTNNKYNPAPEKEVFWSEQSWDEMYEPYIEYTVDSQNLQAAKPAATRQQQ
jgi:hypothetical protein